MRGTLGGGARQKSPIGYRRPDGATPPRCFRLQYPAAKGSCQPRFVYTALRFSCCAPPGTSPGLSFLKTVRVNNATGLALTQDVALPSIETLEFIGAQGIGETSRGGI